jgi:predicted nucleic acid-binding protein
MALYGDRFMVIVDTTVWVDYLREVENPETAWLDRELTRQRLGMTDQILSEVLLAIRNGGEFGRVRDELLKFAVLDAGGCGVAVAENYRALRQRGYTVRKTSNCWIATFCLLHGHRLLHRDRDFHAFEKVLGLEVVQG